MDIKALETFRMIVRTGSFQQAATELSYAQSTVTAQIQKLEEELGVRLFHRGRRVQLTEAGRLLHEQSLGILTGIAQIRESMTKLSQGFAGQVRIGAIEPTASRRIPEILADFCKERPQVQIVFEVGNTQTLSERVLKGELDFAVCSSPEFDLKLPFEPLFDEPMVLLVPYNHPLASKSKVNIKDLAGERLMLTGRNCSYRRELERRMLSMGQNPYSGIEIGDIDILRRFVQQGVGLAILPRIAVNPTPAGTSMHFLEDFMPMLNIGILRNRGEYQPESAMYALFNRIALKLRHNI